MSLIYYPIEGQFYSQRISMTRNLHDWNLRISWNRVGIKREDSPYNNVRQDFTFQVNLIQEPAVSMGVGYDATTETWESEPYRLACLTTHSVLEVHSADLTSKFTFAPAGEIS